MSVVHCAWNAPSAQRTAHGRALGSVGGLCEVAPEGASAGGVATKAGARISSATARVMKAARCCEACGLSIARSSTCRQPYALGERCMAEQCMAARCMAARPTGSGGESGIRGAAWVSADWYPGEQPLEAAHDLRRREVRRAMEGREQLGHELSLGAAPLDAELDARAHLPAAGAATRSGSAVTSARRGATHGGELQGPAGGTCAARCARGVWRGRHARARA